MTVRLEIRVDAICTQEVTDWLGDDGAQRTSVWPVVHIAFTDAASGEVVGLRSYTLRERSAIQTMDDVTADATAERDRLIAEYQAVQDAGIPPDSNLVALHLLAAIDQPAPPAEIAQQVTELESRVGQRL